MKLWLACCLLAWPAAAQPEVKITYIAEQASVQDVVRTIAAQAGLGYNWGKSFDQTNPECRRWLYAVRIQDVAFASAMQQVLQPVGLRYEIESGAVVLYRDPNGVPPGTGVLVDYATEHKSVQYVVLDLAAQVGLGYDFEKSFAQTDPDCRRWLDNLVIERQPFEKAMAQILNPLGLRYAVEGGKVVLYRQ
jgi:hypothetical protein